MMDTDAYLGHISSLAQNARSTWLGLLGLLIFMGIAIMAHQDSDFFADGASTTLPILNIDVPTESFFLTAPVLITAFYCYMNIFLIGLWDALGKIEQLPSDGSTDIVTPLADRVTPTIFTVSALWYRNYRRQDQSMSPRILGVWTVIVAVLLGWVFCWVVLGFVWWRSMPAHQLFITSVAALCLWLTLEVGQHAISAAHAQLGDRGPPLIPFRPVRLSLSIAVCALLIAVSYGRTVGFDRWAQTFPLASARLAALIPLSRADLREADLSNKPADWLVWEDWRSEMQSDFARRESIAAPFTAWTPEQKSAFDQEARRRWSQRTQSLGHQSLEGRDLRGADMSFAFMAGIDLEGAQLNGAILEGVEASGVNFKGADMRDVDLHEAALQGANLSRAVLAGVRFIGAKMQWADLAYHWTEQDGYETDPSDETIQIEKSFKLPNTDFSSTQLEGADLSLADLRGAIFIEASLQGTKLFGSQLQGADFSWAQLIETDLGGANLQGADFWRGHLIRTNLSRANVTEARLAVHTIEGSFLVAADFGGTSTNLSQQDFDNTFGDGATTLPAGIKRPCHWPEEPTGWRYWSFWHADWIAGKFPPVERLSDGACPEKP